MDTITLENKQPHILRAIEHAKTKGVTAIKIELEARLDRLDDDERDYDCTECDEGRNDCYDCDGHGDFECEQCDGAGYLDSDHLDRCLDCDHTGRINCEQCDGEGTVVCRDCEGEWQANSQVWGDARCLSFILNRIGIDTASNQGRVYNYSPDLSSWLQFAKFYNDGSVDSEMTFTVRLDNPENIFKITEVVEAFKALSEEIGNGMNTDGAGMHMAWLFTDNYFYPSGNYHSFDPFTVGQMRNFKRAMHQMMPALFFLAASGNGQNWTRGFNYRTPNVGLLENKYSAIFFSQGAMEFRVFDTCYSNPEQLFDNVVVMSNCLRYATNRYTGPQREPHLTSYGFGHDNSRTLDRLYFEENNLDSLYKHVDKLKPQYYTMRQLRKQRGFTVTKGVIKRRQADIHKFAQLAWKEYEERWSILLGLRIKNTKYSLMRDYVSGVDLKEIDGLTEDMIAERIQGSLESMTERIKSEKLTEDAFIKDRVGRQLNENRPEYFISLSV